MSPSLGAGLGRTAVVWWCGCRGPPCRPRGRRGPGRTRPGRRTRSAGSCPGAVGYQGGLALVVGVLEDRNPGPQPTPYLEAALPAKKSYQVPVGGVAAGDVAAGTRPRRSRRCRRRPRPRRAGGSRSAPGRWGPGVELERRTAVAVRAAGWVGPVQRGIYRQQVGQVVAAGVLEVVDPLDPHRPLPGRLDGERGRVVEQQPLLLADLTARSPTRSSSACRAAGSAGRTASWRSRSSQLVCRPAW